MTGWTEAAQRPNGKTYRARKAPAAELVDTGDDMGVIVWRTHDIDVAVALASRVWAWESGGPLPENVRPLWAVSVPWDTYSLGVDSSVVEVTPDRGTPAVEFRR